MISDVAKQSPYLGVPYHTHAITQRTLHETSLQRPPSSVQRQPSRGSHLCQHDFVAMPRCTTPHPRTIPTQPAHYPHPAAAHPVGTLREASAERTSAVSIPADGVVHPAPHHRRVRSHHPHIHHAPTDASRSVPTGAWPSLQGMAFPMACPPHPSPPHAPRHRPHTHLHPPHQLSVGIHGLFFRQHVCRDLTLHFERRNRHQVFLQ